MNLHVTQASAAERSRNLDRQNDRALARLAASGREDAMRLIIKRHNQRLFRVARGVLRDDAEAEDVVQETYVRAFSSLHRFRGEARLSTWLTRIAMNEALGRVRARRPSVDLDDANLIEGQMPMSPSVPIQINPEAEAARSHVRRVLEEAVDGLPEAFRMVFVLRDVEGMSTEETAGCLAIQAETVKTRLHRARRLLRVAIEKRLTAGFHELFPFDGARCARIADRVIERLQRTGGRG